MRHEIVMPQMGESITTGTITKWHKNVGDKIAVDETLLEISTDKVESEIPSPYEGVIVELLYKEGDTVDVQKLIAVVDDAPGATASAPKAAAASAPAAAPAPAPAAKAAAPATTGGARYEIVMPQMGESITTGTITKWHKKVGDKIAVDETLLEISTDKVESEIPSPYEGTILELLYKEGDTVDVQKLIAVVGEAGASAPAPKAAAPAAAPVASTQATVSTPAPKAAAVAEEATEGRFYTPLVKAMAKEAGIPLSELAHIKGTGAAGRVSKADFEAYVAGGRKSAGAAAPKAAAASVPAAAKAPTAPAPGPVFRPGERVEIVPMDNMRKAIARNMQASKLTSPHVNSIDEVDMTNLVKFRESFKKQFEKEEGFGLTYTHFILYAIVQALKEFPIVNASTDGENIIYKKDINLGCAVAVPGNGLVVPVIKGADNLNIRGLARALNVLVEKARAKKLTLDDMSGGTYTFTNNGSFGILAATPVILQPQLAIFCVGTIQKRPVVTKDDAIAIRQMMYATHTYDHRLIDGEVGSKFLRHVINTLQTMDPAGLF
ncbi:2-oxoglutarate dehydrogenase, E2 component, dihydrolipoamide succinyltransferase [Bacteriovorax stolpii]|uniref:Dihydrolipoamide acetyltransferase component of pyruvate dehydrogenase complex n=1 Tax=Bacteriovorax stolpii TaxID=960 RepID=A0A2K9NUA4_BACTC|nr:2-oxoglutarate dehydrogenase, E2 component, dihydrolipoamide succinyltransferase [Bacteriovorax stolpii]AUN99078.1 2-oxoglutarate dehydrogenase, E2 component, dihydrolipoamide succinyltransferase [Bacteriovorax stolpii]TDP55392.1 2-oxoglutarate dehydrogenase E2 component [Bacteriovorax stolpii]